MKYVLLTLVAVLVESLLFVQLPLAGIVFPTTLLALILMARSVGMAQLMMYAAVAGLALDSLRASSFQPFWLITCLSVALFIGLWRDVARDEIRSRIYLLRMYAPMLIVCSAVWAFVPNIGVIGSVRWDTLLYDAAGLAVLVAVSLMSILIVEKRYGI